LQTGERPPTSKDAAQRLEPPYDGLTFSVDGKETPVNLGRLPWREEEVHGFAFIPGMQRGLAYQDGALHRWSMESKGRLESGVSSTLRQLSSPAPDGRSVVSKTDGRVFDVGAWPPRPTGVRFAHPAWSAGWSHVECTTDGRFMATGVGGRFQTRLWRMPRPLSRPSLPESELNRQPYRHGTYDWAEFDAKGAHAVLYVWGNQTRKRHIQIVDFPTGKVRQPAGHDGVHVLDVAFAPDGRHFAVGDRNGQARVWDAATGRPAGPPLQHSNWVAGVAFSPDGRTLAAGDYGPAGVVKVWDWRNGKETCAPLQHDDIILGVAFSPDGKRLASFTSDDWSKAPRVRQWDLESGTMTGQAPFPYPMHFQIGQTPYRPDGQVLMARDDNGLLCLWDVPTCQVRAQRRLDGRGVSRFSPDGKVVAAAELRGVRLLDGDTLAPLPGGLLSFALDQVHDLTFSPDGAYLLTGHESGSAQLWDVAARKPIGPPTALIGPIRGVAFSADGKTCRCVANDGTALSWAIPTPFEESNLERLNDQIALTTGLRLDDAHGLDFIDAEEWKSLRSSLVGDGSAALLPPRADADWHDTRAADAEQDGDAYGADWHLDRLAKLRPNDWMIQARRGRALARAGRRDEAAAVYRKARELVDSSQTLADWLRVAASHDEASDRKATALWALDLAIELTPDDWTLYAMRARWSDKARMLADLDESIRRGADEAVILQAANLAAEVGDWKRSSAWWNRVAKARALPMQLRYLQALASLKAGDQASYRAVCSDIVKQPPSGGTARSLSDANNAAMVFALGPNATDDWKQPIGWIDHALTRIDAAEKADPSARETIRRMRHTFLNTRGAVLYRAGRFADAAKTLREGMAIHPDGGVFHDWVFLALAEQRLGHAKAAGEAAAKARSMKGAAARDSVWEKAEVDSLVAELDIAHPPALANGGTKK
jgi:WD40 repeat protein